MLNIQLTAKLDRPKERITFALSFNAQMLLGTDDPMLVAQAYPSLEFVQVVRGQQIFTATREDARTLCSDLNERSESGEFGFGHNASERATARRHAETLYAQLFGEAK